LRAANLAIGRARLQPQTAGDVEAPLDRETIRVVSPYSQAVGKVEIRLVETRTAFCWKPLIAKEHRRRQSNIVRLVLPDECEDGFRAIAMSSCVSRDRQV
jgi:hypothetical protein